MGYLLEELTWQQAKDAFRQSSAVVVPTGSIEQHGPHLPVGTDFLSAQIIGRRISEVSPVVVTPTIPIGYADYHADFPGTLSLTEDTLTRVYGEICSYLVDYGATHIVFSNAHGGNQGPITKVMTVLRKQGVLAATVSWFEVAGFLNPEWALVGHGDYTETSVVLAVNSNLVHMEKAQVPPRKNMSDALLLNDIHDCRFKGAPVHLGLRTRDCTDSGYMIEYGLFPDADHKKSPRTATAEIGNQIIDTVAKYTADFITEFSRVKLPF